MFYLGAGNLRNIVDIVIGFDIGDLYQNGANRIFTGQGEAYS